MPRVRLPPVAPRVQATQPVAPAQPAAPVQPMAATQPAVIQPVFPAQNAQQPATFSPPLAMQRATWDSVLNGSFVDAKIFAYSRRSHESGRVEMPRALFVNTHVLASACSYFRSTFDHSDGIETGLTAELPQEIETAIDLEEDGLDSDDEYDPAEESPANSQELRGAPVLSGRTVKAYLVKYTAYRSLRAIVWYIYSGDISFSPGGSTEFPGVSAKTIYRFADEHGMDDLKKLAFEKILSSISRLQSPRLVDEAFSVFTSRYPEFHDPYIQQLRLVMPSFVGPSGAFRQHISRYFSGEVTHSKEFLASLLRTLMSGGSPARVPPRVTGNNNIPRVSCPWPSRTKHALYLSLEYGTFESTHIVSPTGLGSVRYPVYFPGTMDERIALSISNLSQPEQDTETSLSTWRAIAYYMSTECISFKPIGSQGAELATAQNPADPGFRGYQCSPREVLDLAQKLVACDVLVDLAAQAIASGMTLENVMEEMFRNPPPPAKIIVRGASIVRENRHNDRLRSQLQAILAEGASGESSVHADAVSACFIQLFSIFG